MDLWVDIRLNRQSATLDHLGPFGRVLAQARHLEQAPVGVVADERVLRGDAAILRVDDLRLVEDDRLRLPGLVSADEVELSHPAKHDVPAVHGGLRMVHRVIGDWVLHQASEHRRLCEIEVGGRRPEVVTGRGLDAVCAVTVIGDVEVPLQDLLLGELLLHRHRVAQFLYLSGDRRLLGSLRARLVASCDGGLDADLLDVLLGQGRTALTS